MILHDIASLIKGYMGLTDNQIWLKNEKAPKPIDRTLFVELGFMSLKPIGSSIVNDTTTVGTTVIYRESLKTNMQAIVEINIAGRTFDVINRKEEIIGALRSSNSREMQCSKGCFIGSHPLTMIDISELDGVEIPYRYNMTYAVQYLVTTTHTTTY
jgi:hypothetical protein